MVFNNFTNVLKNFTRFLKEFWKNLQGFLNACVLAGKNFGRKKNWPKFFFLIGKKYFGGKFQFLITCSH